LAHSIAGAVAAVQEPVAAAGLSGCAGAGLARTALISEWRIINAIMKIRHRSHIFRSFLPASGASAKSIAFDPQNDKIP
jgi:hypothetical protein